MRRHSLVIIEGHLGRDLLCIKWQILELITHSAQSHVHAHVARRTRQARVKNCNKSAHDAHWQLAQEEKNSTDMKPRGSKVSWPMASTFEKIQPKRCFNKLEMNGSKLGPVRAPRAQGQIYETSLGLLYVSHFLYK